MKHEFTCWQDGWVDSYLPVVSMINWLEWQALILTYHTPQIQKG